MRFYDDDFLLKRRGQIRTTDFNGLVVSYEQSVERCVEEGLKVRSAKRGEGTVEGMERDKAESLRRFE